MLHTILVFLQVVSILSIDFGTSTRRNIESLYLFPRFASSVCVDAQRRIPSTVGRSSSSDGTYLSISIPQSFLMYFLLSFLTSIGRSIILSLKGPNSNGGDNGRSVKWLDVRALDPPTFPRLLMRLILNCFLTSNYDQFSGSTWHCFLPGSHDTPGSRVGLRPLLSQEPAGRFCSLASTSRPADSLAG